MIGPVQAPRLGKVGASMSDAFHIISFGSELPERYADCAKRMQQRCIELDLDRDVRILPFPPDRGTAVTLHKPVFISDRLSDLREPVLWLDCDTSLEARPVLPSGDWDVGFVPNTLEHQRKVRPFSSFAIALKPTPEALHFLAVWRYLCAWEELSPLWDHQRMCWAWQMCPDLEVANIAGGLAGAVVRDLGRPKEHDLRGLDSLPPPSARVRRSPPASLRLDLRTGPRVLRFLRERFRQASAGRRPGSAGSGRD